MSDRGTDQHPPMQHDVSPSTGDLFASFETDLDLDGRPSGHRIDATHQGVFIFRSAGNPEPQVRVPLGELKGCRVEPVLGSSFLQVHVGGRWVDVARCSNGLKGDLVRFAERVDYWAKHGEFPVEETAEPETGRGGWWPRRRAGGRRTAAKVWTLIRPHKWTAALLAVLSLAVVGIGLVPPILLGKLVDDVLKADQPQSQMDKLLTLLLALVGGLLSLRLATAVIAVWKGRVAARVGAALTSDLRTRLVRKLQELPVAYHDRNQVGMLMSRVAYDTEVMQTLVHQTSGGFLLQLLQLVGIGGMLFWINPKLAFFTMLPTPLVIAASWYFTRYLHPRHHHYWEAVGRQAAALTGMLSGIRVVKSFTQEEREFERFRTSSDRLRDSRRNVDASTAFFAALMAFLFGLGELVVWYVGGRDVLGRDMTLGELTAYLMYLTMFYAPLTQLAESTTWISNFLTASQRIFEMLEAPNDIEDPVPAKSPDPFRGGVRFEHVTFGYGDGEPVLRDVDFEVRPGEMIGLVGRSGSGKSTLVSLIGRMYDPKAGRVLVDGVDVREMSRADLRRRIGIVLQDPFLVRGTLAANIVYGRPDAEPERTLKAARSAHAHDFIMRAPFGYDTQVGEGGSGLSGGERQRISIARALLYDPQILILDEATSSVDTESERAIQEALRVFAKGRTTIAIAHRLSTLRDADRLLVFDRGRLVEQGSHAELLARGGVYSSLVTIQTNLQKGVRQLAAAGAVPGEAPGLGLATEDVGGDAALFGGGDVPDDDGDEPAGPDFRLRWLDPESATVTWDGPDGLCLELDGIVHRELQAIYAFPATHPDGFVSLRKRDPLGGDVEIGLVRRLADWPEAAQQALRRSLNRRYLLRRITALQTLRTAGDRIECTAETDTGPATFRLDPRSDGHQVYGRNGRLLVDVDRNYYVISDLDALPARQRRLLSLYFGT